MRNGSCGADASVLFGMPWFRVCAQTMVEGEWWLSVETVESPAACPSCGVFGVRNGRCRGLIRDLPIAGVFVVLAWFKHTWRCREDSCERRSWSETTPEIAARAFLTERARREVWRRVGRQCDTVAAEVAREFGGRLVLRASSRDRLRRLKATTTPFPAILN